MAGHTQNGGGQSGALASHAQWPHTPTPVDTFPAYNTQINMADAEQQVREEAFPCYLLD